jgi:hypothetical protein
MFRRAQRPAISPLDAPRAESSTSSLVALRYSVPHSLSSPGVVRGILYTAACSMPGMLKSKLCSPSMTCFAWAAVSSVSGGRTVTHSGSLA